MDILTFLRQRAGDFRCPVCRRSLADCKMRQLTHQGSQYTVEVTCRKCDMAFVVALELHGGGDGAEEVAAAAAEAPPITADDILDVHRALKGYQGPLTALLEPDRDQP
ncbi:MAG: hypothetical protein HKL89_01015 [Candidatus Dormibacteraeota bacterium]|nr:hypothetical protein [Candidatus Dormibacteraeota bacterium]